MAQRRLKSTAWPEYRLQPEAKKGLQARLNTAVIGAEAPGLLPPEGGTPTAAVCGKTALPDCGGDGAPPSTRRTRRGVRLRGAEHAGGRRAVDAAARQPLVNAKG